MKRVAMIALLAPVLGLLLVLTLSDAMGLGSSPSTASGSGAAAAAAATPTPTPTATPMPADLTLGPFYKCYEIDGHITDKEVVLKTQFSEEKVRVGKAKFLCAPAKKEDKPNKPDILEGTHLKCYLISPVGIAAKKVNLKTQFNLEKDVQVLNSYALCEPALKRVDPSPVPSVTPQPIPSTTPVPSEPRYKCYLIKVENEFEKEGVKIETQFGIEPAEHLKSIGKFLTMCTPALKDGEGTLNLPDLKCFPLVNGHDPPHHVTLKTQFTDEPGLEVKKATDLCVVAEKTHVRDKNKDRFPNSKAEMEIDTPMGPETITLSGPTTVVVDVEDVADTDGDGLEQVETEIVQMELTGTSALLGPVTVRLQPLRDPTLPIPLPAEGDIEENFNDTPGVLDIPPFTPIFPSGHGTADSFFDVFFEIEAPNAPPGLQLLHNETPVRLEATITRKPPGLGQTYSGNVPVQLSDEAGNPVPVYVLSESHTPNPFGIGGVTELPVDGSEAPASATEGSGPSAPLYAALAAGIAAAAATVAAGGWYIRRRWLR